MITPTSQPLEELRAAVYNLLRELDCGKSASINHLQELMKDYKPPTYYKDLNIGDKFKIFVDDFIYVKTKTVTGSNSSIFNAVCVNTGLHHFFGYDYQLEGPL